jgi:atypical dual specificity phosphatase
MTGYEISRVSAVDLCLCQCHSTKGGTAPNREQVQKLHDFVDQHQRIAVHCTSGRRRTGTMLAAYLISTGLSMDEALQIVLAAKPDAELREAQVNFLREFAIHHPL